MSLTRFVAERAKEKASVMTEARKQQEELKLMKPPPPFAEEKPPDGRTEGVKP